MVTTTDGARLGQATWRAIVMFDDGTEIWAKTIGETEVPESRRADAEAFVRAGLGGQRNPQRPAEGRYWGHVQRGHYQDASFDDYDYGQHVTDARWEPDEEHGGYVGTYFWLNDDGTIGEGEL